MTGSERLYVKNGVEWRGWLSKHYKTKPEIWLTIYKKHTGKPCVSYIDAVEEALCFGWIDGQMKSLDGEKYIQRFTPRKPKSNWSTTNIERVKRMIKAGKMTAWGRKVYEEGTRTGRIIPSSKKFSVPSDLKKALLKNKKAWTNFQSLSPSARLMYVYWVDTAKTDETRTKRIEKTLRLVEAGKKLA